MKCIICVILKNTAFAVPEACAGHSSNGTEETGGLGRGVPEEVVALCEP